MRSRIALVAFIVLAAAACAQSPTFIPAADHGAVLDDAVQDSAGRGPIGAGSGN